MMGLKMSRNDVIDSRVLKSIEASGQAMIEKINELNSAGAFITAIEVGKTNSSWVIEFHDREASQPVQSDLFHPPDAPLS